MALKISLARAGSKKRPYYHVVVADVRSPRDGRFIEALGSWSPLLPKEGERVKLDADRIKHWLAHGALPTDRVLRFLDQAGIAKRDARSQPEEGRAGQEGAGARRRDQEGAGRRRRRTRRPPQQRRPPKLRPKPRPSSRLHSIPIERRASARRFCFIGHSLHAPQRDDRSHGLIGATVRSDLAEAACAREHDQSNRFTRQGGFRRGRRRDLA